jgi:hypothetical protein
LNSNLLPEKRLLKQYRLILSAANSLTCKNETIIANADTSLRIRTPEFTAALEWPSIRALSEYGIYDLYVVEDREYLRVKAR